MMPLSMGTQGEEYEIQRIGGNDKTHHFLESLGFYAGGKVKIVSCNRGNLIVQVKESRLALDETMARKVMISA